MEREKIVVAVTGVDHIRAGHKDAVRSRLAALTKHGDIGFIIDAGAPTGFDQIATDLCEHFLAANIRAHFTVDIPSMRRCDRIVMLRIAAALRDAGYKTFVEVWAGFGWQPLKHLERTARDLSLGITTHSIGGHHEGVHHG